MSNLLSLFTTIIYKQNLINSKDFLNISELAHTCLSFANDDEAGQKWCEINSFPGYTSYSSLNDLTWRAPIFEDLKKSLDKHVYFYSKKINLDVKKNDIKLDSIWINILPHGGVHSSHLHPGSVVSGTFYVQIPKDSSGIKFEDPRLSMMMGSPMRKKNSPLPLKQFVDIKPEIGDVILWESWLRHEVPLNSSQNERISISFNYNM